MASPWLVLITGLPGSGKSTLAGGCASVLNASVLGHDWTMAGLAPFSRVQAVLADMDRVTRRGVGWSVMWSLARAELRAGRSVILDGVARGPEVAITRVVAAEERALSLVVLVDCLDESTHQRRIETRQRGIPNWPELSWTEVAKSRAGWNEDAPSDVDLRVDATETRDGNVSAVQRLMLLRNLTLPGEG